MSREDILHTLSEHFMEGYADRPTMSDPGWRRAYRMLLKEEGVPQEIIDEVCPEDVA